MIDYNPHRWRDHLFNIRGSLIPEITGRVLSCMVWAALVVGLRDLLAPLFFPSTVHQLVGVALGLLLVFRTTASYKRFWEGRQLWGRIVNECRNLARVALVHLKAEPEIMKRVVWWTAAFPYAAKRVLRGSGPIGPVAARFPTEEVAAIYQSGHSALTVSVNISELLAEARNKGAISDYVLVMMDDYIHRLMDCMGGCERIRKTPLPYAYMVHLRRLLILYSFSLPFTLVESFGWMAVPATTFVAYSFFGIEEIGVEIEDPFGLDLNDLPLDQFCESIGANLQEILS